MLSLVKVNGRMAATKSRVIQQDNSPEYAASNGIKA